MRKKLLAMILASAMVFTMMPMLAAPAFAANEEIDTRLESYVNGYIPAGDTYTVNGVEMVKDRDASGSGKSSGIGAKRALPSQYRSDKEVWAKGIRVRDQKRLGICWAYGIVTPAEYSYAKEVYEKTGMTGVVKELSAAHIGQFFYNRVNDPLGNTFGDFNDIPAGYYWPMIGGNQKFAMQHMATWSGAALESKYPIDAVNDHVIKDTNYMDVWDGTVTIFPASAAYDDELTQQESIQIVHPVRETMKEMILEYGALSCVMDFDYQKYMNLEEIDPETGKPYLVGRSFYNYTKKFNANHALTIVGWDDNYPKENFTHTIESEVKEAKEKARANAGPEAKERAEAAAESAYNKMSPAKKLVTNKSKYIDDYVNKHLDEFIEDIVEEAAEEAIAKTRAKTTPSQDGAWVVQNSWDDDIHEHGFLYVSYDDADLNTEKADLYAFDMQPADTYKYNFQYDGTAGYADSSDKTAAGKRLDYYTKPGTRAANVYKNTTGEPVDLEAVGYTTHTCSAQEFDVSVYTGIANASDPTSGKLEGTTRVSTSTIGCKTAVLDDPVYIAPGETYSIVFDFIDFTAFGTEVPLITSNGLSFEAQIDPGQSFFSRSKSDKWVDMADYNACFRIKGFANPTSLKPTDDSSQGGNVTPAATVTVNKKLAVPKISSVTAGKKTATVKWKKLSAAKRKKVSGIEIQYSTSKKFASNVKTAYAGEVSGSKKIKGLKSKKRYYVRTRTYKKAAGGKQVSKWSKAKSVKVK